MYLLDERRKLDRFLRRIQRRWIVVRAVERIGLCVLISSAIAIILSLILIFRGESSIALSSVCLTLGLLTGILVAWFTRPSPFDAAIEVDRQLNLADLLATALSIRESKTIVADTVDSQWASTILALAEARCETIVNEPLMLHRFGIRAWSGIGLTTIVVLTLAMVSTNPLILNAAKVSRESLRENPPQRVDEHLLAGSERSNDPQQSPAPESATRSRMQETDALKSTASEARPKDSSAITDSTGAGSGRTDASTSTDVDPVGNTKAKSDSTGASATGGGEASVTGVRGDGSSSLASDSSRAIAPPPWTSHDWPQAQKRASEQLRSGDVPDSYRDLVHDYFSR
jgi:hypothetical protein